MVFRKKGNKNKRKLPRNGGYSREERKYIKGKMEELTDDRTVKDNLMVWLINTHPEILGFDKSVMFELLMEGDQFKIPDYESSGSIVSGKFTFIGDFNIVREKRFVVKFMDPLESDDGKKLKLDKQIELFVRPANIL